MAALQTLDKLEAGVLAKQLAAQNLPLQSYKEL